MNRIICSIAACAGMAVAGGACAGQPAGNLDIYYLASSRLDLEVSGIGSATFDGDGFGVRGRVNLPPNFFLHGAYQQGNHDKNGVNADLDDLRLGGGAQIPATPFYGSLELVNLKLSSGGSSSSESGFGIHAGALLQFDALSLNAEVGYLSVGDAGNGAEYLVGGAFNFTPQWAFVADYRVTQLEKDGVTTKPQDARVGVRYNFR
ncbi:MAG TPA: outer membrane beta-barrel protein [Nevskiaceae bacterium]|nr:outer membrane beta-barrel protein [Nevskiaceae bacterium]